MPTIQSVPDLRGPDLRQDPITGRWVIIAANRAKRPLEFSRPEVRATDQVCPFCPGNEHLTPNERARFAPDSNDDPHWQVRVVPNLYPALVPNGTAQSDSSSESFFQQKPAVGIHDVIIESPHHFRSLTQLQSENIRVVLDAYRSLYKQAASEPRMRSALLFKNSGVAAGISLEHVHSQFVGFPHIPAILQKELDGSLQWKSMHAECIFCRMIDEEVSAGKRLVTETDNFVAICPFASRFPYEVWIVPKLHQPRFHEMDEERMSELAPLYRQILSKLESTVQNISYNCLFHSAPFDSFCYDHYHWHIEIIPRIATTAGLEWGSGLHVNVVAPEQSALLLQG